MGMPKIVDSDAAQASRRACGVPHLVAEPVGWDVPIGVACAGRAGMVNAAGPARCAVGGIGTAAVVAAALSHVVGGEGAVGVTASLLVRLGHPGRGNG